MAKLTHSSVSAAKSVVRMLSCAMAIIRSDLLFLAWGFGIAEVLGVLEEIVEGKNRKR